MLNIPTTSWEGTWASLRVLTIFFTSSAVPFYISFKNSQHSHHKNLSLIQILAARHNINLNMIKTFNSQQLPCSDWIKSIESTNLNHRNQIHIARISNFKNQSSQAMNKTLNTILRSAKKQTDSRRDTKEIHKIRLGRREDSLRISSCLRRRTFEPSFSN